MDADRKRRGNPECYAQALCDCKGPIRNEHYVSESILKLVFGQAGEINNTVLVRGLAFQPLGVREFKGVANLKAKILCERHNEFLGRESDSAGLAMFIAMDALNSAAVNPARRERVMRVDGDALERWMLKTFIGGLYSGNFRAGPGETMKGVCPPSDWLRILFKGAEFPSGSGLYWLAGTPGSVFNTDEEVLQLEPIVSSSEGATEARGLRVRFFGFNFALSMDRLLPTGSGLFGNVAHRPAGVNVKKADAGITFDWKHGAASEKIVVARL
ncbi:MAG: hypothetical protein U0793_01485 [Gemmataceae bacterium]